MSDSSKAPPEGKRRRRRGGCLVLVVVLLGALWVVYGGGHHLGPGTVTATALPAEAVASRGQAQRAARPEGARPSEILFGDLHVHTTFSADAFFRSLPPTNGEGAHPPADACDFARFCSGLDFYALTDHAESLTLQHWEESKESVRQCNAVNADPDDPDLMAFTGFEWTQVGLTADEHYGHKNVIFRETDDEHLPARPIGAPGLGRALRQPPLQNVWALPLVPIIDFENRQRYMDVVHFVRENRALDECPTGVDTRELPLDCREMATTSNLLFEKLDQWGFESIVIPHGTTWGFYTPPGYTWDKQLVVGADGGERQNLVEVYSGHGNSEEYRDFRAFDLDDTGSRVCPAPTDAFEPCCHRAGELIRARCGDIPEAECEARVADARTNFLALEVAGRTSIPGAQPEDWGDCGQCRDCFLPSFSYRPGGSAQYMLARGDFTDPEAPRHARFGFMASSDNHTARPGTGYKELERRRMTEATGARDETWRERVFGEAVPIADESVAVTQEELETRPPFAVLDLERQSSFFLTGGLVAVHAEARSRDAVWEALEGRHVYGTSGDRILLWFDMHDAVGGSVRMGGETALGVAPRMTVRAVGAFEQADGCPQWSAEALGPDRIENICAGECYFPTDERKLITRIEIVRIRPQASDGEPVGELIEDPWRTFACPADEAGCTATFEDPDFVAGARDVLYYARAIEEPSPAVNASGMRCDDGGCDPCYGDYRTDFSDDCLADTEERAWSSPIWVRFDQVAAEAAAAAAGSDAGAGDAGAGDAGGDPG